ncbi:hypothetical protein M501DRAFT_1011818 [Patellaria atrata CBS 101060]|uniref:Rhodopsin domain-containing protein n=1 Tax=Patellaria atrata CBS 101060 TaxID=1346257 RepID=A0A9P4S8W9_9PEZI|nr:hypothetical protein M501DRAFT_1011818 [Patellaria atrata CBS 101060]
MDPTLIGDSSRWDRTRQWTLVNLSVALTVLSGVFVVLRIGTRLWLMRNVGSDDYMIIAAFIFTVGYLAEIIVGKHYGMGISGQFLNLDQMTANLKNTVAVEITYYIILYCIKVSILLLYLRIAVQQSFRRLCIYTIGVLTIFVIICIIVCLTQCIPLHKFWDLTGTVQGSCINSLVFFYFTSSFNIVTDIWILALPIKTLLSIQRPTREKLALYLVFGMGAFSLIASIIRLHTLYIFVESADQFYDVIPVNVWSIVEVTVAIICASIPSLKPLISKSQREPGTQGKYGFHSIDKMGELAGGSKLEDRKHARVNSTEVLTPRGKGELELFELERDGCTTTVEGKEQMHTRKSKGAYWQSDSSSQEDILPLQHPAPSYNGPGIMKDTTVEVLSKRESGFKEPGERV